MDSEQDGGVHPINGFGDPGRLLQIEGAQPGDSRGDVLDELLAGLGDPKPDDRCRMLQRWVVDPVIEAAAFQSVVQIPGPVGGEDDNRLMSSVESADLWDRHGGLGEQLEEERLKLLVRSVNLVYEQDGGTGTGMLNGLEQRSFDQVLPVEKTGFLHLGAARLSHANAEELAWIVPLVESLGGIDSFEALEADQRRVQQVRECLGCLSLAHAGFTLE